MTTREAIASKNLIPQDKDPDLLGFLVVRLVCCWSGVLVEWTIYPGETSVICINMGYSGPYIIYNGLTCLATSCQIRSILPCESNYIIHIPKNLFKLFSF